MREESIRVDTNELRLWRLQICCDRGTQVAFSQRIVSLILVILVWKRFLDNSPYLQIIISDAGSYTIFQKDFEVIASIRNFYWYWNFPMSMEVP